MKDIGYVCSGDGGQITTYDDFADYIDDMLYVMALDEIDLTEYRAIVIPDFSNEEALAANAAKFDAYLAQGGFLIAFEPSHLDRWLSIVDVPWFPRETEDWKWWMNGGRLEVYQPEPRHPMAEAIPLADMSWHFFGAYRFFEGARPILNLDNDEGCIMFDYRLPEGGGRLICSTIDPHVHSGRRFMWATTRFLKGFYPWLKAEVQHAVA